MNTDHPVVFIHTEDAALAIRLVRQLYQVGISGFWVTEEEARKLGQVWCVETVIRDRCEWRN